MKDNWGRTIDYLRISVTDRCNLRCQYCMPEEGIEKAGHHDILSFEEIIQVAQAFLNLGIRKIRITGGEPTVRKGIVPFIHELKSTGVEELTMTTNGQSLVELAKPLKDAGLDRINVSLDTLHPDKYKEISRGGDVTKVLRGIEKALEVGLTPVKMNAVLMKGINDEEIEELCAWTVDHPIHVRFIELMPIGHAREMKDRFMPVEEVLKIVPTAVPISKEDPSSVATLYKIPGAMGTIGLIQPLSNHFCGDCNRVRLHANGNIQLCLHNQKTFSIRDAMKEGNLEETLQDILLQKPEGHKLAQGIQVSTNMSKIGG